MTEKKQKQIRAARITLCVILGMTAARLLGNPTNPVIAISAILVVYTDRGYRGSIIYGAKRVLTQVIMGGIVFALMWLCSQVELYDNWILSITVVALSILMGLTLNDRFEFAPLPVTLSITTLIMASGMYADSGFYFTRIVYCAIGAVVAYVVNLLTGCKPESYQELLDELLLESERQLNDDFFDLTCPQAEDIGSIILSLESRIQMLSSACVVTEADEKTLDAHLCILQAHDLFKRKFIKLRSILSPEFISSVQPEYYKAKQYHKLLACQNNSKTEIPALMCQVDYFFPAHEEIHIFHYFLRYVDALNSMAEHQNQLLGLSSCSCAKEA